MYLKVSIPGTVTPKLSKYTEKAYARLPCLCFHQADLATERERQFTRVRAKQTTGLTNGRAANWAPEVAFSPFRVLFLSSTDVPVLLEKNQEMLHTKSTYH